MATGFQVINDNGILQIDEYFRNMVLVARGTVNTARPNYAGSVPYERAAYAKISYPVSGRQPVLALRCSVNTCFTTQTNGFTVFTPQGANELTGYPVEYFIYDRIDFGNAAGNTGMQVFNAQGVEVFNSNNNYMKVLGAYDVNLVVSNAGTNPAIVPTHSGSVQIGKRLAVAMGVQSTGYWVNYSATGQAGVGVVNFRFWNCQVVTPADNSFTISNTVIHAGGGPGAMGTPEGFVSSYNSGLILDVTGL
jgi:hypothetical protein